MPATNIRNEKKDSKTCHVTEYLKAKDKQNNFLCVYEF